MTHQPAASARRRNIDQHWTVALADPDFQCVCLFAFIGILIERVSHRHFLLMTMRSARSRC